MKRFILYALFAIVWVLSFTACSEDDDIASVKDDNSPCYVDYFMAKYYDEFYFEGESILDKRDIKSFDIRKYEDSSGKYCLLLTIDYYESNYHGYISSILNTLDSKIRSEFNSDDYLATPGEALQVLCKHSHCLKKYSKYNTK